MKHQVMRSLVITAALLLLITTTVLAQAEDPPTALPVDTQVPELLEVFRLLAGGVGTGVVLAFLFERFAFFQALKPDVKWWVIFGTSLGLPLLAEIVLQILPPNVWALIEPYWQALARGFLAWGGSQVIYKGVIKLRQWNAQIPAYILGEPEDTNGDA